MTTPVSPLIVDRLGTPQRATPARPGSVTTIAGREPDSASLSAISKELGELSVLLGRIRSGFAAARRDGIAQAQSEIDHVRAQLATWSDPLDRTRQYEITHRSDRVTQLQLIAQGLAPGEEVALRLHASTYPEPGAAYIQIPGGQIDITKGSEISITIAGNLGEATLSFASSQTLGQVMRAINHFSSETGVFAESIGASSGFVLRSNEMGSNEFISVRSVEGESNINMSLAFTPQDAGDPLRPLHTYTGALVDFGRDLRGTINGQPVSSAYGNKVEFAFRQGEHGFFAGSFDFQPYDERFGWDRYETVAVVRGLEPESRG